MPSNAAMKAAKLIHQDRRGADYYGHSSKLMAQVIDNQFAPVMKEVVKELTVMAKQIDKLKKKLAPKKE
ncbi:MAG: hypothetical protein GKS05_12765 [Nitrospirales bacterium]|nr:hypothetical protein [Nitrospirales bacterium]